MRIPVSTGRDSSRDAARATRPVVSRNAARSTLTTRSSFISTSRGKSSGVETFKRYEAAPQVRLSILEPLACSIVTSLSLVGRDLHASTNTLPGTTLAPSSPTSASSDELIDNSISVAAKRSRPFSAVMRIPAKTCTDVLDETARATSATVSTRLSREHLIFIPEPRPVSVSIIRFISS